MARLRATLAVDFGEGDVIAATAQRLGVHINTTSYRLRQCEELLERPVKQRRFEFEAALVLRPDGDPARGRAARSTLNARAVGQRHRPRRRLGVIHKPIERTRATMPSVNCPAPPHSPAEE